MPSYAENVRYLEDLTRMPGRRGRHFNQARTRELLELLGNPQRDLTFIHVAGTTGKGSTVAMISSVLTSAGIRVGRFLGPHLESYTERIAFCDQDISPGQFADLIEHVKPAIEYMKKPGSACGRPTLFEVLLAAALVYFHLRDAQAVVLEAGVGGAGDPTNVVNSAVAVITNIGRDHLAMLGPSLTDVARNKAGIIKPGGYAVTACGRLDAGVAQVLEKRSTETGVPLRWVGRDILFETLETPMAGSRFTYRGRIFHEDDLWTPLAGRHQVVNGATAVGACEFLAERGWPLFPQHIKTGLAHASLAGRLEVLSRAPMLILDSAHNPPAARALRDSLALFPHERLYLILGILADKDQLAMARFLVPPAHKVILCPPPYPSRAGDCRQLETVAAALGKPVQVTATAAEALAAALGAAAQNDLICVTGSMYLVGAARTAWRHLASFSSGS